VDRTEHLFAGQSFLMRLRILAARGEFVHHLPTLDDLFKQ